MRSRLLALTCVAGVMSTVLAPRPLYGDAGLVQRLEEIESAHPGLCPDAPPQAALHSTVRLWAAELRPGIAPGAKPTEVVAALNHFLVEQLAIRSSQDLHDPCNLLPSAVVARRQGYCVGVAALYLALAQELELPMFAVATPSHVFLRYDDGMTTINIDTTQIGVSKSDADYAREGRIPEKSIRKGVFLQNLSEDGFLAQVHNNLGVIYSERKNYASAAMQYRQALDLDRRLPAAWYNWGNDLLKSGDYAGAIRHFSRSLDLFPADVWALNNRGVSNRKRGKVEHARRDFEAALRIDPGFDQARSNLDALR